MTDLAISTRHLCKDYGSFPALIDLDLDVCQGEIFGFLGPNGAGKSTTIRILMDELRPTSGTATLLGLDSRRDAVKLHTRLGYLPADVSLYPHLTGHETIRFFSSLRGGVDQRYTDDLAERLQADLTKKVGALSTGNRQKIGLIITFMHRPELLILDEPNAGLDPLIQYEFHQLLEETIAEGRTVFLSSHTLSEVERVATRVGIIRKGRLIAVEDVATLRSKMIRHIKLTLADEPNPREFDSIAGVSNVRITGKHASFAFDGPLENMFKKILQTHTVHDITTQEADLEDVFLTYYREESAR